MRFMPIIIAALGLAIAPAAAQTKRAAAPASPTLTLGKPPLCDPLNLIPGCKQSDGSIFSAGKLSATNPLLSVLKDFADFINGDNTGAINLSQAIKDLPDGNGYACWSQMRGFSEVVNAHPIPLTLKLQSDIEALRLLMMAANKVCGNSACQQMNSELKNGILAAAPVNAGVSIPFDLNTICSKIPQVSSVALPANATPIPVPASTTPTATPANP